MAEKEYDQMSSISSTFSSKSAGGQKPRSLRVVAFCGVAFSTVAVLSSVITLPLVYNYVQTIQSYAQSEVDYCKVSSDFQFFPVFLFHLGSSLDLKRHFGPETSFWA